MLWTVSRLDDWKEMMVICVLTESRINDLLDNLRQETKTYKSSAIAEMGDRVTIDMGRKEGAAVPLSRELGPRLIQFGLGRGLLRYLVTSS